MIVALDIDGVIADILIEFGIRLKKDYDISLPVEEWKSHRIETQFPEVDKEWVDVQLADPAFWLNAKAREDAWYMCNKWFMEGNDVHLVTARGLQHGPETVKMTERWLDEWEFNYNRLWHSETRLTKYVTCLKLGADFLVEDDPHEVQVSSQHLPCYLLDHPYNRDYDIGKGIRVGSLYELDQIVTGKDLRLDVLEVK